MSDSTNNGPVLAADGTPLKRSLRRSLRLQKFRALLLIAPLLAFILITFIAPIADMLFRSVENKIVEETLPQTIALIDAGGPIETIVPNQKVFSALYVDMFVAAENKEHTRLGTRLNYEQSGISSLFRKSGRRVARLDVEVYKKQFEEVDPQWADVATWQSLAESANSAELLPRAMWAYNAWRDYVRADGDNPDKEAPEDFIYVALYDDLIALDDVTSANDLIRKSADAAPDFETVNFKEAFVKFDKDWASENVWKTLRTYSTPYTEGYFLNAIDFQKDFDGYSLRPDNQRIYGVLFMRTLFMSLVITACAVLLGYPIAWLMANRPMREANLLMIMVLLPFWTSLLVRTSAWKVMLQQQGVINDTLVWLNLVDEAGRLVLINNQFGTIVAMTHILLPFMVLPLYSVMRTIPESYTRAAKSLGATNWTAFWRVYFPQSVPGIGAGSILVFILSIGYYITPEIVGGTTGTFISNRIAYHISSSLNWGLAAALGTILLAVVLLLYWVYDRIVGIDNVKLGG
ncbi:ABC transporter permease [Sneathiella litorea]|uniref:ABC transporter permease subunit n=1 Tax=Sneathiella litorea TaxID=2606216 RepID=A0A6L8W831_9PROT|nr:ABC transporter permease [Sneathiella litorea]MZR30664.1 ABC transporter permease subunit [Sneathiella litorea]